MPSPPRPARGYGPPVRRSGASQGEALVTWALWAAVLVAIVVTYARLDPAELYHVSRDGLAGGLSRALVVANFPLSLVAIALCLVAVDALGRRAWWLARAGDRALRRDRRPRASSTRPTSTRGSSTPSPRSASRSPSA